MSENERGRLLLIDGNSLINRAFYGQGASSRLSSTQGMPTGALHTFLMMYLKYLKELEPSHVCVAFDTKEQTFRHRRFADYKGHRSAMPEDLAAQLPVLKELLDAMNVRRIELAGYEADDLIGTLARRGEERVMAVDILTGDKDAFQLITDKVHVIMPPVKATAGTYTRYDEAAFRARYGIVPAQFVDVKALMGDSSDNIPGVPGIGEKTALKLIAEYGSLDALYAHTAELKGKQKEKVEDNREQAYLSQELSRIDRFVPLAGELEDLRLGAPASENELRALLSALNLNQLLSRMHLKALLPGAAQSEQAEAQGRMPDCARLSWADFLARTGALLGAEGGEGSADPASGGAAIAADSDAALYIAFSPSARAYKTLKQAAPLLSPGACFGWRLLRAEGECACMADCPEDAAERRALAELLAHSPYPIHTYRSKTLWREGLLDEGSATSFDAESAAYALADLGELRDFSALAERVTGRGPLADCADEEAALRLQLDLLPELCRALKERLAGTALEKLCAEVDFPLARTVGLMERRGICVDPAVLDELHEQFRRNIEALSAQIHREAGREFNINSPQQLGAVLFEELGLPSGKKRQNAYATDQNELQRLKSMHPIVALVVDYRMQTKLDSTFVQGLKKYIAPEDGRIHSYFNLNYTSTGRFSSKDPNLQNIPVRQAMGKEIRRAFVARPGAVLIDADYSQIELRLLAHLADERQMIEAFSRDRDIHLRTAAHLFGLPEEEINAAQRAIAKTVNFSIIYGISAFGLAQDLEIPVGHAKGYIDDYHRQYPGVRRYMEAQIAQAKALGYVETLSGRRRYVDELKSGNFNIRQFGERVAMNSPIQGTAADIIRIAMLRADEAFRRTGLDAALVSQVHDELIVEVAEAEAEQAAALLREAMEGAFALRVPLKADLAIGRNWFDAKS